MSKEVAVRANTQAVLSLNDLERMANSIAKSGMFAVKTPEGALTLLLLAQAQGIHPAQAMLDFDIINNRPAKRAEAMSRDGQHNGMSVQWHALTDEGGAATFSHPRGGTVRIDWDIARATRAGLAGKDNWKKYTRAMLRSRILSEGSRTVCPMATSGMYTPEEVMDMEPERDVTPAPVPVAQPVAEVAATNALTDAEREDHIAAMKAATTSAELATAFTSAWKHSGDARDATARALFKAIYDACNAQWMPAQQEVV